jgi:GTPase
VAEVLVRKLSKETMDIRVCVIGNVDSGKSTLVGVLTTNELDNGRGMARTNVFRHRHELENGRTSAISRQIMGFDAEGKVTNGDGAFKDSGWQGIIERSAKIITFLDLAGHESYLKTTLFGLIGQIPDYGLVAVAANNGVLRMTKEHVGLALTLRIPLLVVVTKIDICPPHVLDQTVEQLEAILSRSDAGKTPVVVRSSKDVLPLVANKGLTANTLVPIFLVSSVTGKGLNALRMFLNLLPKRKDWSKYVDHPAEFAVDDSYSVEGVGTVVTGMLLKGSITTGDKLLLGPGAHGEFTEAIVKSVHVKRTAAKRAVAGQAASLALKRVPRARVRKGMALLHPSLNPRAVVGFDARVRVLNHPNGIQNNYEPVVHCGTIRQSARVVSTDPVCFWPFVPTR